MTIKIWIMASSVASSVCASPDEDDVHETRNDSDAKRARVPAVADSSQGAKRQKNHHRTSNEDLEITIQDRTRPRESLSYDDYTVAWICALPLELAAAQAVLDDVHEDLPMNQRDSNHYTVGNIRDHNIVIACLPTDQYGIVKAASVASNLKWTFKSLRFTFTTGIGGAAPSMVDLRLGDVVVGVRIMQTDFGKSTENNFKRTASWSRPPDSLGTLISKLQARHMKEAPRLSSIIQNKFRRLPEFRHPNLEDRLFQATYEHESTTLGCDKCDRTKRVHRSQRESNEPMVHYGAIASSSQLIRSATYRDDIARELDIICFEMEAAGIVDTLPCLVIRGISDYSDSHKNKHWQRYAAAAAAACARELLEECREAGVDTCTAQPTELATTKRLIEVLKFDSIQSREQAIKRAHGQTCKWLPEHPEYRNWLDRRLISNHHGFLWVRGKPGAGKSTIMKYAYSELRIRARPASATIAFFFNARGEGLEKSVTGMFRSLLWQLLHKFRDLSVKLKDQDFLCLEKGECPPLDTLEDMFSTAVLSLGNRSLTCFIDALDESDEQQVVEMIHFFESLAEQASSTRIEFRVCFSSRHYPYIDIRRGRQIVLETLTQHRQDMESYVKDRLRIGETETYDSMRLGIIEKAAGVFLWVVLVVQILNKEYRTGRMALETRLAELPSSLSELFEDILRRGQEDMCQRDHDELLLSVLWTLFAEKPLSPREFDHALWAGLRSEHSIGTTPPDVVARSKDGSTGRYIISSSKGLAELTETEEPTVQFIHESVRDFLIKDRGLCLLWQNCGVESLDYIGLSHDRLKICCQSYLQYFLAQKFWVVFHVRNQVKCPQFTGNDLEEKFTFLRYTAQNILYHANKAAAFTQQGDFLSRFPFADWVGAVNVHQNQARAYTEGVSLMYVLAERGFTNLVRARDVLKEACPDARSAERFRYPLFAALANGKIDTFCALLGLSTRYWGETDVTEPLSTRRNYAEYHKTKLTPLLWAVNRGLKDIVRLLLKRGAKVDKEDLNGDRALFRAMDLGHTEIVGILIHYGARKSRRR